MQSIEAAEQLPAEEREPTAEAVDAIPQERLLQLIAELPEGYRTVFNLYCLDGCSHREIAAMLRINEKSSSSQLARARALLAARIRDYYNKKEKP